MYNSLRYLDEVLEKQNYICSNDEISLADIVAQSDITQMRFLLQFDYHIEQFRNVKNWYDRMLDIPEIQETMTVLLKLIAKSQEINKEYLE